MVKTLNFKNKKAYMKWLAYGHLHTKTGLPVKAKVGRKDLFDANKTNVKVKIAHKLHHVHHY